MCIIKLLNETVSSPSFYKTKLHFCVKIILHLCNPEVPELFFTVIVKLVQFKDAPCSDLEIYHTE